MLDNVRDRVNLFLWILALPSVEFEALLFALNPPGGIVPGNSSSQGDRLARLLEWVESPKGCGINLLFEALEILNMPPEPPFISTIPKTSLKNEDLSREDLSATITERIDNGKFTVIYALTDRNSPWTETLLAELETSSSWKDMHKIASILLEKNPIDKPEEVKRLYLYFPPRSRTNSQNDIIEFS